MSDTDQFSFDFDEAEKERPFQSLFDRLARAAAEEFSEINLCLAWMFRCDGRNWRDWFDNQPKYEQMAMLNDYRYERDRAENGPMRPYRHVEALRFEALAQENELTDRWAEDIRRAAIERRPIPFGPGDLTGFDLDRFNSRMWVACNKAGVIPIQHREEVAA